MAKIRFRISVDGETVYEELVDVDLPEGWEGMTEIEQEQHLDDLAVDFRNDAVSGHAEVVEEDD